MSVKPEKPKSLEDKGYDYIIVGSGAGGAPLAARLAAKNGIRVLLIEAGEDHGQLPPQAPANEVTRVPGFHGLSSEHEELAWRFFVDHYDPNNMPPGIKPDPKRHSSDDPQKSGIFYPRSSSVGGCTIHNAMITIAGPDSDWDEIADELQDDTWRGNRMRAYFQKVEHNDYMPPPPRETRSNARMVWDYVVDSFWWLAGYKPDRTSGKHGFDGWLHTSVADLSLGLGDKQLVKMLTAALWQAKLAGLDGAWTLVRRFLKGEIRVALDPNHIANQNDSPEGVVMIPVSVYGDGTTIHQNKQTPYAMLGNRSSPRELLHETQATYGDKLTIWTNCFATKVIFESTENGGQCAVGVQFLRGKKLYKAHYQSNQPEGKEEEVRVKAGGEVVLCGGTFNTPQLLMLSGVGDRDQLKAFNIDCKVHSPGVGKNLQDRYEVSVVGEMNRDFDLLRDATFELPNDGEGPDPLLKQWRDEGTGLYSSNGAVVGIFKRSRPDIAKPDLFIFGVPLEFRGYEVGYSKVKHHDRFTWVILKSHSHNRDGQVTLRSNHPLDTPKINFNSFQSKSYSDDRSNDPDVIAMADGVEFVRGIYRHAGESLVKVIHPQEFNDGSDAINAWIRSEAWGHHACGTCRMGRDGDPLAVLDSQFRVRGVDGLRVVDASIFPKIPGYFIVSNIYMASEKAADVISASREQVKRDSEDYPNDLFVLEKNAIKARRQQIPGSTLPDPLSNQPDVAWDSTVTGLALSGGGIRSATLNLGVLQTLARTKMLRKIDFLSTVSGGGYIGAYVGRMYDRLRQPLGNAGRTTSEAAAKKVEEELSDSSSHSIRWLRKHGNYIAPNGKGDAPVNAAIFVRNLISVHFVIGLAFFSVFGIANFIRYFLFERFLAASGYAINRADFPIGHFVSGILGPFYGPWFVLVELILLFFVLPRIVGYWIVSQDKHESFKKIPLFVLFLISSSLLLVGFNGEVRWEPILIGLALFSTLIHVELAWKRGKIREAAVGTGGVETQRLRTRNYLTYDLGLGLTLAAAAFVFAFIDSLGHALQQYSLNNAAYTTTFASLGAAIVAGIPLAKWVVGMFSGSSNAPTTTLKRILTQDMMFGVMAVVLFLLPLILYSYTSHVAFHGGLAPETGIGFTLFTIVVTVLFAFPSALAFVNRSSLSQTYSARLARAYLGASNPLRYRPDGMNITEVIPGDDVASIQEYQPHLASGPLHIVNVTINQTEDSGSRLQKRDRKGENLAVSSVGFSVGEKWHGKWELPSANSASSSLIRIKPLGHIKGDPHPLIDQLERPANRIEKLSLRTWIGISGAAIDPGRGRGTNLGTSLLMGLINLRTGHWWDTGIPLSNRDGFPDLSFARKILYLIPRYFATQCLLISEWAARFPGPWERFWHLSDGGFFENTGAYELVRRRIPRIIICDASADPKFEFESFAEFVRKVRIDFGATVESITSTQLSTLSGVPQQFVGTLDELRLSNKNPSLTTKHAALFWITYADNPNQKSILLYIKASMNGDEPIDIGQYHSTHLEFPHESTDDQFFDEAQWESYRKLGEHISSPIFATDWFWNLP